MVDSTKAGDAKTGKPVKKVTSPKELEKQKAVEKKVTTEIHRPTPLSVGNIPITLKLKKNSYLVKESVPISFTATFPGPELATKQVVWKIYYCPESKILPKMILIASGFKKGKGTIAGKGEITFKKWRPSSEFTIQVLLFINGQKIASQSSEKCFVQDVEIAQYCSIKQIQLTSPIFIPKHPLVFWVTYTSSYLPKAVPIAVKTKLLIDGKISTESVQTFLIGDDFVEKPRKIPFQVKFPITNESSEPKKNYAIGIEIGENDKQSLLFSKVFPLKPVLAASGVYISHVGFKREIPLKEIAYLIAEIENETNSTIKGQIEFMYFTPDIGIIPIFKRKFHVEANNREVVSEDKQLPEILGGRRYWVIGRYNMNIKKAKLTLAGDIVSTPWLAKPPSGPVFNAKINGGVFEKTVQFNEIVPISVDIRIDTENRVKNAVCEVIENLEHMGERIIYRFKLSDQFGNGNFRWKVPPICANVAIEARLYMDGIRVDPTNMKIDPYRIEIIPPGK
jgi:hypothetical protein